MNVDVYENGALLKATIGFNDITIEPVVGDYIRFDINFWNSYNGQWSIQISGDGRRLFCMVSTPLLHAPSASTVPTSTQNKKPPSSHAHSISSSIKRYLEHGQTASVLDDVETSSKKNCVVSKQLKLGAVQHEAA